MKHKASFNCSQKIDDFRSEGYLWNERFEVRWCKSTKVKEIEEKVWLQSSSLPEELRFAASHPNNEEGNSKWEDDDTDSNEQSKDSDVN